MRLFYIKFYIYLTICLFVLGISIALLEFAVEQLFI